MCWATKSLLALALMVTGVESFAVQKCLLEGRGLRRRPAVQGKTRVSTVTVSASASAQPLWVQVTLGAALLVGMGFPLEPALLPHSTEALAVVGSEEGRVVAEAWKVLDRAFVDSNFNGVDWRAVRREYVGAKNYKNVKEAYGAVSDMASKLGDKYTRFVTPSQYQTLQNLYQQATPSAGVGVEVYADVKASGAITVLSTVPGSPAERAGVGKGSVIEAVGGKRVGGSADDAASLLRGQDGSQVELSLKGVEKAVVLSREKIKPRPVTMALKSVAGKKVAVVRVPTFAQTTKSDVLKAIGDGRAAGGEAVLIDLRGNLGGSFPAGVDLAKSLLGADQTVVFVVGREGPSQEFLCDDDGSELSIPLALLVDSNTASAAEVFAAALQDNARAKVVGTKTFGKGLVQTIAKLQDGSALVVTVARYETPKHTDINKKGIVPDIQVTCPLEKDASECLPTGVF